MHRNTPQYVNKSRLKAPKGATSIITDILGGTDLESIKRSHLKIGENKPKKKKGYSNLLLNSRMVSLFHFDKMTTNWSQSNNEVNYTNNLTTTKCVIYFIKKTNGKKFLKKEIDNKENRYYFDSYDWIYTREEKRYINELGSMMKLVRMCEKQFDGMFFFAEIFVNIKNTQYQTRGYYPRAKNGNPKFFRNNVVTTKRTIDGITHTHIIGMENENEFIEGKKRVFPIDRIHPLNIN